MRVLILNGNPQPERTAFEDYLGALNRHLHEAGHESEVMVLRDMNLNYCVGCYACWLKTPGICAHLDDGPRFLTAFINADVVVYASPIIMGLYSSLIKKAMERVIPLVHPHITIKNGRSRHLPRYDKSPVISLLLDGSAENNAAPGIVRDIFRAAGDRQVFMMENTPAEEVSHALDNL